MQSQVQPAGPPLASQPIGNETRTSNRLLNRQVWRLAIPAIGENLLQTSLMIVDTLMIAPFGAVPLAAAAVASVLIWRAQMTFGCIEKGTTAMVARYTGAGDLEGAAKSVAQSIWLAIGIGLFLTVSGVALSSRLLGWMGAEPAVVAAGTPYLQVIFLASIPRMFFFVAAASLRGAGDTRSPMWITLWMNVLNIGFNFPLIYGLPAIPAIGFPGFGGLGLTGSGISTSIALSFSAVAVGYILWRGRSVFQISARHFRPDFKRMKTLFRIAAPSLLEEILISVGFLTFFWLIALLGTAALAAHSVASRIESLSFMAGFGFAIATATLVGQSLGMRDVERARQSFRASTKYSILLMSVISLLLILFGRPIVNAFFPADSEVAEVARLLLLIAAVEQPLLGICMTLGGGLRGAGDTFSPMIASLICSIFIRVGASYVLAFTFGLGIYGMYLGTLIDWLVRASLLFYFYHQGRWARIRL